MGVLSFPSIPQIFRPIFDGHFHPICTNPTFTTEHISPLVATPYRFVKYPRFRPFHRSTNFVFVNGEGGRVRLTMYTSDGHFPRNFRGLKQTINVHFSHHVVSVNTSVGVHLFLFVGTNYRAYHREGRRTIPGEGVHECLSYPLFHGLLAMAFICGALHQVKRGEAVKVLRSLHRVGFVVERVVVYHRHSYNVWFLFVLLSVGGEDDTSVLYSRYVCDRKRANHQIRATTKWCGYFFRVSSHFL